MEIDDGLPVLGIYLEERRTNASVTMVERVREAAATNSGVTGVRVIGPSKSTQELWPRVPHAQKTNGRNRETRREQVYGVLQSSGLEANDENDPTPKASASDFGAAAADPYRAGHLGMSIACAVHFPSLGSISMDRDAWVGSAVTEAILWMYLLCMYCTLGI